MQENEIYSSIIVVSASELFESRDEFFEFIQKAAALRPRAFVLREKELSDAEYWQVAAEASGILSAAGVPFFVHSHPETAAELCADGLQLPFSMLSEMAADGSLEDVEVPYGTSAHSVTEARLAEKLGAAWIFAGNIFETSCKEGLEGRGLEFLKGVCEAVSIPVYAIGGIDETNLQTVMQAGAAGGCMRSGFLKSVSK